MQATIDISLYPLNENYKEIVLSFIEEIKSNKEVEVITNGLSTQLFGDYDVMMGLLTNEMKKILIEIPAVFTIKLGRGILKFENN